MYVGYILINEDPDLQHLFLSSQRNFLNHLLHPNTLQRITNSRLYGNTYSVSEMMQDLTSGIFNADANGNVNTFRQNIQVDYVTRLASILEGDTHDNLSRSSALYYLQQIRDAMYRKSGVHSESSDHARHIIHIADKALDQK